MQDMGLKKFSLEFSFQFFSMAPDISILINSIKIRRWRVFGKSAHLPQRPLWKYSGIVWVRLRWRFLDVGRRSVLRRYGRMRTDWNVRQWQVHQHGRIVQVRLRFRLQIIVRWKNLRRSVDSNFPIQNQIPKKRNLK